MSRAASIRSRDLETVETELMLADLESLERRAERWRRRPRAATRRPRPRSADRPALALLREGKPARLVDVKPDEEKAFRGLGC